ncbi:invasion protein, partial [Escherichia coli]|nr:invasion protein [Escherichia coli]
ATPRFAAARLPWFYLLLNLTVCQHGANQTH